MTDQQRETLIELYRQLVVAETNANRKQLALLTMQSLIADRTPAQVHRMERDKRLSR